MSVAETAGANAARPPLAQGRTGEWEVVIGLEVHAQVSVASKLFSGAATAFGAAPNSQVSLVDAAMPGMLPVINEDCIEQAVRTGLGLNAQINLFSVFDRKNYFYADLPQGYQISQYSDPIVGPGTVTVELEDGTHKAIRIHRLHLEQDAGKSIHDQHPSNTFIDLNRAGVPLMEIVTEPDISSAAEAGAFLRKLRAILRYLGTCDGNMEEGSLRCDANVSVRKPGGALGTRAEIKNLNSIRFLMQAVDYEVERQIEIIEDGGKVDQETRLYDSDKGETRSMRSKEEVHDYRYFPDPDLLPVVLDEAYVAAIKGSMPELPDEKMARYMETLGLSAYAADRLVAEREVAAFFEEALGDLAERAKAPAEKVAPEFANFLITDFFGALNKAGLGIDGSPVSAKQLAELQALKQAGTISGRTAKDVFDQMWRDGKDAGAIVAEQGLTQVSDSGAIEAAVAEVIAANPDQVAQFKAGKDKVLGFFVGQIMKATKGKANPQLVNEVLRAKLSE